jgi:ABC-type glycerol-3-phosphate transport system substrate-binding protein
VTRLAALALAALALAGCGGGGDETALSSDTSTQATPGAIVDLENVLGLAADFRADEGKTRVLLVFSPT